MRKESGDDCADCHLDFDDLRPAHPAPANVPLRL
jgi:hypothetical protein